MPRSIALDIRDRLARYLAGARSLTDLRLWLASAVWDIEGSGDQCAVSLLHALDRSGVARTLSAAPCGLLYRLLAGRLMK